MLFNAWDPRHYNVILHERVYENHIVAKHGEIAVEDIQYTVENPDIITADVSDEMTELCYAKGVVQDEGPDVYLKVCARFEGEGMKVVTAYLVDRPKPTERIIWPLKP
jgi:hypothetical protein